MPRYWYVEIEEYHTRWSSTETLYGPFETSTEAEAYVKEHDLGKDGKNRVDYQEQDPGNKELFYASHDE